jgi:SWI/SNF-related matrix-associated actin-dependent regulator 1 of chromatin subfamily A
MIVPIRGDPFRACQNFTLWTDTLSSFATAAMPPESATHRWNAPAIRQAPSLKVFRTSDDDPNFRFTDGPARSKEFLPHSEGQRRVPVLTHDGKRFLFRCQFDERHLPKSAGFEWRDDLKWHTVSALVAARLREYATGEVRRKLNRYLIEVSSWPKPLPEPPAGLKLLPHQVDAAKFALSRNRSYLGLDPGLGKTIVAATVARALGAPVVYVSPPFLVRNVEAEFRKWAPEVRLMVVPDTQLVKEQVFSAVTLRGAESGAVLIVDEAHRFKNPEAKRTQYLLGGKGQPGIVSFFSRQIFMSGTPMPNRPMELYPILARVAPETVDGMSMFDYGRRFCAGHKNQWGWDFSGASNLTELRSRVIHPDGPFMLRLKKNLLDLPPKTEEVFVISADMSPRLAKLDRGLGARYGDVEDLIKARIAAKAGKDDDELHLGTYRRLLGLEKVQPIVQYIESLLEETDENILVFAYHKEVIAQLSTALRAHKHAVITGETPTGDRQAIVERFQKSSDRILIGNYLAMGVGFTLTKATRGIFVEYSWVPGENEQAGDRMHRIGQKGSVLVQYVVYENSVDKAVIETLMKKRRFLQHV